MWKFIRVAVAATARYQNALARPSGWYFNVMANIKQNRTSEIHKLFRNDITQKRRTERQKDEKWLDDELNSGNFA